MASAIKLTLARTASAKRHGEPGLAIQPAICAASGKKKRIGGKAATGQNQGRPGADFQRAAARRATIPRG